MTKVFGKKIVGIPYEIRKGVYSVIFNSTKDKVMTVRNERGHHFLPGGGMENGESHKECLERKLLEETGCEICMGPYIGNALRYFQSTKDEPLLSEGYFYLADLSRKVQEPKEHSHSIEWIDIERSKQLLVHEHHCWAVEEARKEAFGMKREN